MTKKDKFIQMVNTMLPYIAEHDSRVDQNNYDLIASVLGKAYKVKEGDLDHQYGNLSDKVVDFITYQLYITPNKPVWYSG